MTRPESTSTASPTREPRRRLFELIWGYRITQVLYAAASLGLAEALRSGPCGARDLAATVGAHEPSLVRLLHALVSLGLLEMGSDGRYDVTDTGRLLDGQSPGSVRAGLLYEGLQSYEHWRELVDSVRTGQNVYQRPYGIDAWTYRRTKDREGGKLFDGAMQEHSASRVVAVVEAYDFSGLGTIIDVGGGRGSLLAGFSRRTPRREGYYSTSPPSSGMPPRSSRRPAWQSGAVSSAGASSRTSHRMATRTSSRSSSTTGMTNRQA